MKTCSICGGVGQQVVVDGPTERYGRAAGEETSEANLFALELLLPTEWLARRLWQGFGIDPERLIESVAQEYAVPSVMVGFRLAAISDASGWGGAPGGEGEQEVFP